MDKKTNKKMMEIVATNGIASQPPEWQLTAMPIARAIKLILTSHGLFGD